MFTANVRYTSLQLLALTDKLQLNYKQLKELRLELYALTVVVTLRCYSKSHNSSMISSSEVKYSKELSPVSAAS